MARFVFEPDRIRYSVCHGNLRRILGGYLQLPPSQLQFEENAYGKPRLSSLDFDLHFNLSHSADVALLAVARGAEVGVDVEQLRPIETEIAEQYFSARELLDLEGLDGSAWLHGFYNCWTRKEAILKAEGVGLNVRLDAFDVTLRSGVPARLLAHRANAGLKTQWVLSALRPCEDSVGALATTKAPSGIFCWQLAPDPHNL